MVRGKKKEKILTPEKKLRQALVPESEWPYKVPGNWRWVYLTSGFSECLDSHRSPINASERASRTGDIPYYGATGQVGWIDDYLTDEELVLLGEDGAPFLDLIKDKAYIITGKAWVNNHAHILKSYFGHFGNLYLCNYLNIFNFTGYVNGTTRLKLTQASMNTIPVPLPPLPEQQRIVDRIESLFEKLDEAKEKAQAVVDGFEDRKAAILHKAFSGELTEQWRKTRGIRRDDWKSVSYDYIAKAIDPQPSHRTPPVSEDGIPYVGIAECNYENGMIDFAAARKVSKQVLKEHLERYRLSDGDFIIGKIGTIGKPFRIPVKQTYALSANVVLIQPLEDRVNSLFLFYFFQSDYAEIQFKQGLKATTQAAFGIKKVRNMSIVLPSSDEQHKIVKTIEVIMKKEQQVKEASEQVIEQIDVMKKTILARAFRGELGTNNPSDESAEELLKRIL